MLKRIIVPLDGSEVSEQVFGHLDELASPETMIFPTMVIEPAVYVGMGGHAIWNDGLEQRRRVEALSYLRSAMESNGWGRARYQCVVKQGSGAARAIVETAIDQAADLIAMSSRGRTGLSRLVLGSVAREVARLSPVRVVIVGDRELALAS